MNFAQAIAQMESRFGPVEQTGVEPQDWEAIIPDALERTKEWAYANGHRADFIRQDPVALGAEGEAAIPTDMLAGRVTRISHADSLYDFAMVPDRASLKFVSVKEIGHYCVDTGKVWTILNGVFPTGNLLIEGLFDAALGTLPSKMDPYFFENLAELGRERLGIDPIGDQEQ